MKEDTAILLGLEFSPEAHKRVFELVQITGAEDANELTDQAVRALKNIHTALAIGATHALIPMGKQEIMLDLAGIRLVQVKTEE